MGICARTCRLKPQSRSSFSGTCPVNRTRKRPEFDSRVRVGSASTPQIDGSVNCALRSSTEQPINSDENTVPFETPAPASSVQVTIILRIVTGGGTSAIGFSNAIENREPRKWIALTTPTVLSAPRMSSADTPGPEGFPMSPRMFPMVTNTMTFSTVLHCCSVIVTHVGHKQNEFLLVVMYHFSTGDFNRFFCL